MVYLISIAINLIIIIIWIISCIGYMICVILKFLWDFSLLTWNEYDKVMHKSSRYPEDFNNNPLNTLFRLLL